MDTYILTVNGGSSSIKFSVSTTDGAKLQRCMTGELSRIGLPGTTLVQTVAGSEPKEKPVPASSQSDAVSAIVEAISEVASPQAVTGIGHRIVHGGLNHSQHMVITDSLIADLKRAQPLDAPHLPGEIALVEAFAKAFPGVPQVACFDTEFHRNLPRSAQLLPLPRRYDRAGVRRFGFHGLSYTFLMGRLAELAGEKAAKGKLVLAHLGSGASMVALRDGQPMDTSMAFTPDAGLVMGSRTGDMDPGLISYLVRTEKLDADQMDDLFTKQSGLKGVSELSSDMRDLIAQRAADIRAAEAVDLFCYQAKKTLGAYAAVLNGLETLVFSGGIGARSPEVRAQICQGMEYLGLELEPQKNHDGALRVSTDQSRVAVWVIPTDEEAVIAKFVTDLVPPKTQP